MVWGRKSERRVELRTPEQGMMGPDEVERLSEPGSCSLARVDEPARR